MALDDIKQGDQVAAFQALRDHLVESLKVAETGQVAALSKQLQAVLSELARLDVPVEDSLTDDLARRRSNRIANTATPSDTVRRTEQRRARSG